MTTIGQNLRTARERLKLTADQAAARCNVCRATWYAWEANKTIPPVLQLIETAKKLKTTASDLLAGVEVSTKGNNP